MAKVHRNNDDDGKKKKKSKRAENESPKKGAKNKPETKKKKGVSLDDLRAAIKKSGRSMKGLFFLRENERARIRFLDDLEENVEVKWHSKFVQGDRAAGVDTPCLEHFGLECPYCNEEVEGVRNQERYAWTIYNYENDEVQVFIYGATRNSPISAITALAEEYGNIVDRDYVITQRGVRTDKTFNLVPRDKSAFKNSRVKPLTEEEIMAKLRAAYNIEDEVEKDDDDDDEFEEEDEDVDDDDEEEDDD